MQAIAVFLLYLASFNALMSYVGNTCTMGDADVAELIVLSVILFLVAAGILLWRGAGTLTKICLLPLGLFSFYLIYLAWGFYKFAVVEGIGFCAAIYPGYGADDMPITFAEKRLAILWLIYALAFAVLCLFILCRKNINAGSSHIPRRDGR